MQRMPIRLTEIGQGARKKKKRTPTTAPRPKKLISASNRILPNGRVELTLPILTISEANTSEHWSKASTRHKKQKQILKLYYLQVKEQITLPVNITLIRLAPRKLDYDNMTISMKWILDSLCEELTGNYVAGRADSDERINVSYEQEKSREYGIRIIFDCNPYHFSQSTDSGGSSDNTV